MKLYNTLSKSVNLLNRYSNRYIILLNAILTVLAIYFLWTFSNISNINPDAGYYLSIAKDIGEGLVPYKDVMLSYPPLTIYILSLAEIIVDNPGYSDYLYVVFLFQILSCFLVYKIAYFINKDRASRYLISLITLFLVLSFEGIYLTLEPFVIFFALLSYYFYLISKKSNYFLLFSGISAGMCFLSKQYGLVVAAVIPLNIIFENKILITDKVKMLVFFSLGFLVPITLFCFYFIIYNDIPASEMISKLSAQGYGDRSLLVSIRGLLNFLLVGAPYIFILPLLFFYKIENKEILFSLILFIAFFSLPLYFKLYTHYFILIIPFCTLAGFYIINSSLSTCKNKKYFNVFSIILILSLLGFLSSTYLSIKNNFLNTGFVNRDSQLQLFGQINKWVPRDSQVLLVAHEAIYFINDLQPPKIDKFGYVFLQNSNKTDRIEEIAQTAQYAITNKGSLERLLQNKEISVVSILKENHFIFVTDIGDKI